MIRTSALWPILLYCAWLVSAETVSLSGTVTKTGSIGIAGVKISLMKLPSVSTTTSADGSFALVGTTSVLSKPDRRVSPQLMITGNTLTISPTLRIVCGRVDFFSGNGKRKVSIPFTDSKAGSIILPGLMPGINVVRLTLNGESYTRKVVSLGTTLFFDNETPSPYDAKNFINAKKTASAYLDTLVAEKDGYMFERFAISSYSKNDITIRLDSAAGNPDGHSPIPPEAGLEDISHPDQTIGNGTPQSCTPEAFIAAVAKGGTIVFNGGAEPFTITLSGTAKVFNNANPDIVIDGGGIVTLSGGGTTRILYLNTCDEKQVWTTPRCDNQDHPRLTVQNLTFIGGNAKNADEEPGGGAIFAQGGRLKIVNCRFYNNVCAETGPDVGGGAVRAFMQYDGNPVYVVNSTFGGAEGLGNVGSNGGALSSIGVSWTIINSLFSYNRAIGNGGNPQQSGTPGGGSGGAIYNDGNTMTLSIYGTLIEKNSVNAYGAAIFFVTNDHSGNIRIDSSTIRDNIGGSWYPKNPGISMHDDTRCEITNSTIK